MVCVVVGSCCNIGRIAFLKTIAACRICSSCDLTHIRARNTTPARFDTDRPLIQGLAQSKIWTGKVADRAQIAAAVMEFYERS